MRTRIGERFHVLPFSREMENALSDPFNRIYYEEIVNQKSLQYKQLEGLLKSLDIGFTYLYKALGGKLEDGETVLKVANVVEIDGVRYSVKSRSFDENGKETVILGAPIK